LPPWDQCLLGPYSGNDGCKPAPGSLKVACRSSKAIDNHRHPISSGPVQAGALSSADHPPPQQARMQGNTRCQMQHQTHTACRVQWRGSGSAQQTRQPKPPRWDCMACCTPAEATTLSRVGVVSPCHASCHASGLSDGPRSAQVARRARNVGGYMATPSPGVARNSWALSHAAAVYEGESGGRWVAAASHHAESRAVQKKPARKDEGSTVHGCTFAFTPTPSSPSIHFHRIQRIHHTHIPISDTRPPQIISSKQTQAHPRAHTSWESRSGIHPIDPPPPDVVMQWQPRPSLHSPGPGACRTSASHHISISLPIETPLWRGYNGQPVCGRLSVC